MNYKEILDHYQIKFWLCGTFSAGKLDNLKDSIGKIYDKFDGLVCSFHLPKDDGSEYLESIKKEGKISYIDWCYRLDHSRNTYLWSGVIKNQDLFINIDDCEQIQDCFFDKLGDLLPLLIDKNIDGVLLHNKRFMYFYNDYMEHRGNPHEGIVGCNKMIELTQVQGFENSDEYFRNLRHQKREPFSFVDSNLRYYLSFPTSNHTLLGLENDLNQFKQRDELRKKFRIWVQKVLKIDTTIEALKTYIETHSLNDNMRYAINNEKILNDFYRYHFLNDRGFNGDMNEKRVEV